MTRIVAVTGGSGSGKTTFAHALARALEPSTARVIAEDDYYICSAHVPDFDPVRHNFDAPEAKEAALLEAHLHAARRGEGFDKPLYDFTMHRRRATTERVEACDFLIVEGLHLLASGALREAFDFSLFIDVEEPLRLARRMARDIDERQRTPESVVAQWFGVVRPMYAAHVAGQAAHADLVLTFSYAQGLDSLAAEAAFVAQALRKAAELERA